MKIELNKNTLAGALTALGKLVCRTSPVEAYRCIEVSAHENVLYFRTHNTDENIIFSMEAETEGDLAVVISFEQFRTAVRNCKNKSIVFEVLDNTLSIDGVPMTPSTCTFPELKQIPVEAKTEILPETFIELLNTAAPVVNRNDYRKALQGINLSRDGITTTNGKELFNAPVKLDVESLTIPFPLALIATKATGTGKLAYWTDGVSVLFQISIGSWTWSGKAVAGTYPNWKLVMPEKDSLKHSVTFSPVRAEQLKSWLKNVPDDPPNNAIELRRSSDALILNNLKGLEIGVVAYFTGEWDGYRFIVNRDILLRLLNEGHTKLECPDGHGPFLATGGIGQYIAMPLYQKKPEPAAATATETTATTATEPVTEPTNTNDQIKETNPMIDTNTSVVSAPVQTATPNHESVTEVSPMEDLTASIEAFKLKLKTMFDESNALSRKVKEVALSQKQKERDFILAKRAIERIRMAI